MVNSWILCTSNFIYVKNIQETNFTIDYSFLMKRELQEPHPLAKSKQFQTKDLPTDKQLREIIETSSTSEKIWLAILIMSGRRGIDVARLKWKNVQLFEHQLTCVMEKDKANKTTPIAFACKFKDLDVEGVNSEEIISILAKNKNLKKGSEYVVEIEMNEGDKRDQAFKIFKQKLTRRIEFCIHGIRRRRAVIELLKGKTEDRVSSKIGWRSKKSISTYVMLSSDQIDCFKNYSEFQKFMYEQCSN